MTYLALAMFANVLHARSATPGSAPSATTVRCRSASTVSCHACIPCLELRKCSGRDNFFNVIDNEEPVADDGPNLIDPEPDIVQPDPVLAPEPNPVHPDPVLASEQPDNSAMPPPLVPLLPHIPAQAAGQYLTHVGVYSAINPTPTSLCRYNSCKARHARPNY